MKLNQLERGIYKIRRATDGGRFASNEAPSILRVTGAGDSLRYYIDADLLGQKPSEMNMNEYEVVSKYDGTPTLGNCTITLTFADASGDKFEFTTRDAWGLRNIFDAIPWLQKPFGYVARKRK
jgi:hypothetical protein